MGDFLKFKKMVTPIIIQIMFWFALVYVLWTGVDVVKQALAFDASPRTGILIIILGPLALRIYCEVLIVIFSINDRLTETQNLLKESLYSEAE